MNRAPEMTSPRRSVRVVAAALALVALGACGDAPGPSSEPPSAALRPSRPVAPESLEDAPWERAFDDAERTATVEGRIITPPSLDAAADFVPCPDADVELWLPRPDGRALERRVGAARTGPDGRFRVEGAVADAFALRVTKPGHAQNLGGRGLRLFSALPTASSPHAELAALPARPLRGEVVDRGGAPHRGVRVLGHAPGFSAETTTDDAGAFSFGTPPGPIGLTVLDPRCDVVRGTAIVPSEGDVPPARIVAATVEALAGTVVDAADGRPLAGAVVVWLEEPGHRTRTGDDGRFVLAVPRTGRVAAFVHGRAWRSWPVPRAGEIVMPLHPSAGIAGRVVDAEGRGIADARLFAVGRCWDGPVEVVLGPRSDAEGRFDFSWAPPPPRGDSRPTHVVAWHRLRGASVPVALPVESPRDLVLSGWRAVEGVLRDARDAPVADAAVTAEWALEGLGPLESVTLGLPDRRQTRTGAGGAFRLVDLPGAVRVTVRADVGTLTLSQELPPGPSQVLRLSLPPGLDILGRVVRRDLQPPGAAGEVSIRLLDAPGLAVERKAPFGADGAFRFEEVPPGRYAVSASAEGFDLPGGCEARAGDRDVRVVVERSARLHVRIAADAGSVAEVSGIQLVAYLDDLANTTLPGRRIVVPPSAEGGVREFEARVHPGNWRVRVEGGLWRAEVPSVALDDGEDSSVSARLEKTLRVRGTLRDGNGAPLPGVQVLFVPDAGVAPAPVTTFSLPDGAIDVVGLRAGGWEVRVAPRLHAPARRRVTLPLADPLDIRLPAHGDVLVRVRGPGGTPVPDAIVALRDVEGRDAYGWSEDLPNLTSRFRAAKDGTVRIVAVPAGEYRIEASSGSSRFAPRTAAVRAGETAEVVLGDED